VAVARVGGVDVARGLALLGMFAVHVLPTFTGDGGPTTATVIAGGRSAATFVLVAGIGLAFVSGGRRAVRGAERIGVGAGLAVRAALIAGLGLLLGELSEDSGVIGILPYYGLYFLLAVPLVGLGPRALAVVAAAFVVLGPVLLVATADVDWPTADLDGDPTFATLLGDPVGLLTLLTVTGYYPAVVYLAYLCAGMAIGRLDLGSRRVAWWILGVGAALAVAAQAVSAAVLYAGGGLAALAAETSSAVDERLLWQPDLSSSWWYLALPAPHSHSTVDVVSVLGSAMVVVGAALLLTRVPAVGRLLQPLAAAGSMVLTLYSAHLVVLASGFLDDDPALLYVVLVVAALTFAWVWRRVLGRGPLERVVTAASGATRRAAASVGISPP
jgi:uncharacterized membrane protein